MPAPRLAEIVKYCDRLLRTPEIKDYDGAENGLQVENSGTVTRIAACVDATPKTVALAVGARADLMIVHHGLFWSARQPWTGANYRLLRALMKNNVAVYSSHLPLDAHPVFGNNARLCKALGFRNLRPFFTFKEQALGLRTQTTIDREELRRRLGNVLRGEAMLIAGGPKTCRAVGVVTGGAGSELKKAADEGVDTFITGEGPHWTFALAEELGVNVFYGGHYATETFGVKALAKHLSNRFKVPWEFLDYPTGL
jgi:dinuclear metal center YbgI/SA1388 family protein